MQMLHYWYVFLLSLKYSGLKERFSITIWQKQGLLFCAIVRQNLSHSRGQLWHPAVTLCGTSEAEIFVQQPFAVPKETERHKIVTSRILPTNPYFTKLPIFSLLTFIFWIGYSDTCSVPRLKNLHILRTTERLTQNRIALKSYHYRPHGGRTIGRPKKRWREQL